MKFHARLTPSVVAKQHPVISLVIHSPARAAGVTVKIWELDTFIGRDGKQVREGSKDDLLAEITGDIEPGPGKKQGDPEWRVLKTKQTKIIGDDEELVAFRLKLPGSDQLLRIPIVSEKGEHEGRTYELGVSLEHGGSQKFKTKSPCLFSPPLVYPRFALEQELDGKVLSREPLRLRWGCIGTAKGEGLEAKLDVLGFGWVDLHGRLVDDKSGQPLGLRRGRPLFAYVHAEKLEVAVGPSKIPIALCDPVAEDGTVVHRRPHLADPFGFRVLGMKVDAVGEGGAAVRFGEAPAAAAPGKLRRLDDRGFGGLVKGGSR